MAPTPEMLSEKEKETLRLIVRGHDAKSAASALGLSVHTINERLRSARRKLDVTSSREAARVLLERESGQADATLQKLGYKALGDAHPVQSDDPSRTGPLRPFVIGGLIIMSFILSALLLPISPVAIVPGTIAASSATSEAASPAAAASAAEDFLVLIDESRWAESYAATGKQFRKVNTLDVWTEVSERVRRPLGKVLTRNLVTNEFVPAPPEGYQLVKFASSYADGTNQVESVSLAWEDGAWKVVGIVIG
jgi:DNA-binding CsgD family transcriptional regulator